MRVNIGSADRLLRLVAGFALLAFGLLNTTPWRYLGLAGIVLVLTALVRFCPAYALLGIRTCTRPTLSG
ncbi:MAG: DUF2892 domain-containing protein [Rhodospirillales bacterium]|nr:DUF2892 domain-containing protein [Rhodospirillales bacterium]